MVKRANQKVAPFSLTNPQSYPKPRVLSCAVPVVKKRHLSSPFIPHSKYFSACWDCHYALAGVSVEETDYKKPFATQPFNFPNTLTLSNQPHVAAPSTMWHNHTSSVQSFVSWLQPLIARQLSHVPWHRSRGKCSPKNSRMSTRRHSTYHHQTQEQSEETPFEGDREPNQNNGRRRILLQIGKSNRKTIRGLF